MSGRVFFTPQAGRSDRSKREEEEPWGMTASQSQFRAFEPAEARNARGGPMVPMGSSLPPSQMGSRKGSTVGGRARSEMGRSAASSGYLPGQSQASTAHQTAGGGLNTMQRPIPEHPFLASSTYQDHGRQAQEARNAYFPYRDEFAPRSKRLLYEMAHARCCRDDTKSESHADSVSCFTVASSGAGSAARQSSVARSASEPNILTLPSVGPYARVPTADSQKVSGGVARRRKEFELRAPTQWKPDHDWLHNTILEDGPAGLTYANHAPRMAQNSLRQYGEQMNTVHSIVQGDRDCAVREQK